MTFTANVENKLLPSVLSRVKTKVRLSAFAVKKKFFFLFECYNDSRAVRGEENKTRGNFFLFAVNVTDLVMRYLKQYLFGNFLLLT